jgi:hypothetical protein
MAVWGVSYANELYYRDPLNPGWIKTGITNVFRVDGSTNTCFCINASGTVYSYNGSGSSTQISATIKTEKFLLLLAITLIRLEQRKWLDTRRGSVSVLQHIYRGFDGSVATYIDDERVRPSKVVAGSSQLIPVATGTYTVKETMPGGWGLQKINVYDPTANSGFNLSAGTASIKEAANEVVYVGFQTGQIEAFNMTTDCANAYLETFKADQSEVIDSRPRADSLSLSDWQCTRRGSILQNCEPGKSRL